MDEVRFGGEGGFHVEVQQDPFASDCFVITIWPTNHGVTIQPVIRKRETALALAEHLYNTLLPEHIAAQERHAEWMKKFEAEQAARPKPKPPRVLKNAPKIDALLCSECGELILPDDVRTPIDDGRVYECNDCGTRGVGYEARRCESCHKFTSKLSDTSCPECEGPMDEAEKVQAQRATNKTLVRVAA